MSSPKRIDSSLVVAYALGLLLSSVVLSAWGQAGKLDKQRQAELQHMLKHDCGSCHGMTLKGGLGPALAGDALSNKPKPYLRATISDGHPGTPMPPWKAILTPAEIDYLVELLLLGMDE